MRSCCILVVLACAIGGRALESRPALATRSVPRLPNTLALVRGGARPKPTAAPTDIEKRVKTMHRCIRIVDMAVLIPLISCYVAIMMELRASIVPAGTDGCLCDRWMRPIAFMGRPILKALGAPLWLDSVGATVGAICVLVVAAYACHFVAGSMLRAWRPREFDEALQSKGRDPVLWTDLAFFSAQFPLHLYVGYRIAKATQGLVSGVLARAKCDNVHAKLNNQAKKHDAEQSQHSLATPVPIETCTV